MAKLGIILLLQSALLLHCVFSVNVEFFNFYGPAYRDTNFTQNSIDEATISLFDNLKLSCGSATSLKVLASGRAILSSLNNAQLMVLNVFGVDIGEVDMRIVNYRFIPVRNEVPFIVDTMKQFYVQYFPRQNLIASFEPETTLVVTWQIVQEIMSSSMGDRVNNNTFQMVVATQGNRSLIAFLYDTLQWGASTAVVSVQTCGLATWTPSGTQPAGETVRDTSNLLAGRRGEWLFFVPEDGRVMPAVVCRTGCSLSTGYCTEHGTCLCRENWSGNNCDTPVCPSGCVNGNCGAPNNCTCNSGWSGVSCNVPLCHDECINGGCNIPYNCSCRTGWIGPNCYDAVCAQSCGDFGFCTRPNHCSCIKGYGGSTCDPVCTSDTCEDGCSNGNCTSPNTCVCESGWTGTCCNITVVIASSTTVSTTMATTDPTQGTSGSLSGSTIGAIAGSIAALVVIVLVIAVIFIIALISC